MGKEHNKLCLRCLSAYLSLEVKEALCAPFTGSCQDGHQGPILI